MELSQIQIIYNLSTQWCPKNIILMLGLFSHSFHRKKMKNFKGPVTFPAIVVVDLKVVSYNDFLFS